MRSNHLLNITLDEYLGLFGEQLTIASLSVGSDCRKINVDISGDTLSAVDCDNYNRRFGVEGLVERIVTALLQKPTVTVKISTSTVALSEKQAKKTLFWQAFDARKHHLPKTPPPANKLKYD